MKTDGETLKALTESYIKSKDADSMGKLLFALCASADTEKFNAEEALYKEIERKIDENR